MALNLKWELNPRSADLPRIEVGDRLVLHAKGGFEYKVRADVIAIDGDSVNATVVDIFARDVTGQITGGEILELQGKTLALKSENVFSVLKR